MKYNFKVGDKVTCIEEWTKAYGVGTIIKIGSRGEIGVRFSNYTQYHDEDSIDYHTPKVTSLKLSNSHIIKERLGIDK